LELYLTDFNLMTLLHHLRDLFQLRARQKGLTFVFEVVSHLPQGLYGDEKRLRQIMINLLGNAIKFTPQGGVIFTVSYENGKLHLQVSDTGIGIAPADLTRIFIPFQQAGDQNYRPEGTGLGLSITRKLVELMGGELQVNSQLGQGSTFGVVLALPESSQFINKLVDKPVITGFQIPPHLPLSERGEVVILVIDDRWENRSVLVHLLTPLGFKVLEASQGQEGLEMARRWSPALIISDLVMPVMDGFELARRLRQLPEFQTVPMIAATASVFDLHSPESLSAGYNEVITKPLQVEQLRALLQRHLGLTWNYAQSEPSATSILKEREAPEKSSALLVGPAKEQLAILLKLGMIGDIGGILEELDKLEQQDPQLIPFVTEVRQLARNFDEARICEMVQRYMDS
jgi:CheY-like chemotaxis protein/anti-sigma regulatory factor (Ser/Thr protein kinase)